jgi:hypothetical protein
MNMGSGAPPPCLAASNGLIRGARNAATARLCPWPRDGPSRPRIAANTQNFADFGPRRHRKCAASVAQITTRYSYLPSSCPARLEPKPAGGVGCPFPTLRAGRACSSVELAALEVAPLGQRRVADDPSRRGGLARALAI